MNNEIIVINPLKSEEPFSLDGLDNRKRVVAAYCRGIKNIHYLKEESFFFCPLFLQL